MVKFKGKTFLFNSLVKEAYLNRVSLSSSGFYSTPKIHFNNKDFLGRPFSLLLLWGSCFRGGS